MQYTQFEKLAQRIYNFDRKRRILRKGVSLEEINQAQNKLQVQFPESYVSFLKRFGTIEIDSWEVFGLGLEILPHLDLIKITLSERLEMQSKLATHLVPLMNNGAGDFYCLDTKEMQDGECPVVFWDHEENSDQETCLVAKNFLYWLEEMLNQEPM